VIHEIIPSISIDTIRHIATKKNIFIWGAGNQGRGIAKVLIEHGITPTGYIDSSTNLKGRSITGLLVNHPDIISKIPPEKIFIIISVFFYEQEISDFCRDHGLVFEKNYIHYSKLKPRDYSIDISGSCNLHCLACPRASRKTNHSRGVMSFETFCKVIDKIKREDPFVGNIQLYQWGEPTINKALPEMISYAHKIGILCAISSNLNLDINYKKIIEAKPEWFRISASNWGPQYEITHSGGNWDIFKKNLHHIALLRKKYHPGMKLELYYHIYQHSVGESMRKFKSFCKELSIEFHPVYAYLISLDDILRRQEGIPLPEPARQAQKLLLLDLDEGLSMARLQSALPCDAFRSIHINADLSVSNCMMYFYPEGNRAIDNYLNHSVDEIMSIRLQCDLCRRCMSHGIHRYCGVYATYTVVQDDKVQFP
jgi:pyruvate-formate lyase-activating enzyme